MLGKAPRDPAWVSWVEAAEIVGCPVTTIESHVRNGHISRCPAAGHRPTLDRASVHEFAAWWRDRQQRRKNGDPAPSTWVGDGSPGQGWLRTKHVAEMLEVSEGHVGWLARHGTLPSRTVGGRLWFPEGPVEELAHDRAEWVSQKTAALIVGCSTQTIQKVVERGDLESRGGPRSLPSVRRASAEAFAGRWRRQQDAAEETRRRRAQQNAERNAPPDQASVWLDAATAARALGISANRVRQLARAGRLSYVVKNSRYWFRREHIEQVAASRAFRLRREAGLP